MTIPLTKLAETSQTITVGWAPVPGAIGYRFVFEHNPKPSHTWNPEFRRDDAFPACNTRYSKASGKMTVEALTVKDSGVYPPVSQPPTGDWYPDSWQLTGPLGSKVPLPKRQGAFLIVWPGQPGGPTTWDQFKQRIALRESQWGRKPDAIMVTDDQGVWGENRMAWVRDRGCLPILAGINFGGHDGVLNGSKNAVIDAYAQRYKALGVTVMIRLHHEFNYTHLAYTSVGQEQKFIDSWKYIVDRFHRVNGAANVGFWFCPAEGGDNVARASADACFDALSPEYIDWVGTDNYNHCWVGETGCYSTPYESGFSDFGLLFDYPNHSRHSRWGPEKPFVIGETGTAFDPNVPTRKAQWLRSVAPAARAMEYLAGIAFFDIDASYWEAARNNWILDHRTDVPEIRQAMNDMARDPWLHPSTIAPLGVVAELDDALTEREARYAAFADVEPVFTPIVPSASLALISEAA